MIKLNLIEFFEKLQNENYAVMKFDTIRDYQAGSDIDIFVGDIQRFVKIIMSIGCQYLNAGYEIKVSDGLRNHTFVDFNYDGKIEFRFDLYEHFHMYRNVVIDSSYFNELLLNKKTVTERNNNSTFPVYILNEDDELFFRYLEFVDWYKERPDKIKHLSFIGDEINSNPASINFYNKLEKYSSAYLPRINDLKNWCSKKDINSLAQDIISNELQNTINKLQKQIQNDSDNVVLYLEAITLLINNNRVEESKKYIKELKRFAEINHEIEKIYNKLSVLIKDEREIKQVVRKSTKPIPDKEAVAVIFSKNRPMQLDAALQSLKFNLLDFDNMQIKVLYKTTDLRFQKQYDKLITENSDVEFTSESNFKSDLLKCVAGYKFILFIVDDTLFVKEFKISEIIGALNKDLTAAGFSLRLGENTDFCYMRNLPQRMPNFEHAYEGILKYNWTTEENDFNYPLEVSSSVYRSELIMPFLENLEFTNPNTFEEQIAFNSGLLKDKFYNLYCFNKSVAFANPVNLVQTEFIGNRINEQNSYSPEVLLENFEKGYRIDINQYQGIETFSCHQEMPFAFYKSVGDSPAVSVVIPCYNSAAFLGECLQSLVEQTFTNWEAIVVDDCSTMDNPQEVVKSFNDSRIRIVRHLNNKKLSGARNTGFKISKSEIVLPLDADDKLHKEYLINAVNIFNNDSEINCVTSHFQLFGSQNDIWAWEVKDEKEMTIQQWMPGPGTIMRKKIWQLTGGYSENINLHFGNEDWDFWLSAATKGMKAFIIPNCFYYYRRFENSMSQSLMNYDFHTREHIYQNHKDLFDKYGTGNNFRLKGYINSCVSSWGKNEKLRALLLACKAYNYFEKKADVNIELIKINLKVIADELNKNFESNKTKEEFWNLTSSIVYKLIMESPNHFNELVKLLGDNSAQSILNDKEIEEYLNPFNNTGFKKNYNEIKKEKLNQLKKNPANQNLWKELAVYSSIENDYLTCESAYEALIELESDNEVFKTVYSNSKRKANLKGPTL